MSVGYVEKLAIGSENVRSLTVGAPYPIVYCIGTIQNSICKSVPTQSNPLDDTDLVSTS